MYIFGFYQLIQSKLEMLETRVGLFVCLLITLAASAKQKDPGEVKTTPRPDILSRFHQNDYKLAYEWAEVVRVNKRFGDFKMRTFKYNRTCTATNATFTTYFDMGNEVEAVIQAYRFASNEYRLFPLRLQFNMCEAVAKQSMGFDKFAKCGNFSCPIQKGNNYHYCNWNPEESRFPPFIPTGKYMIEQEALYRDEEVFVVRSYGSIYRPIPWE